MSKIHHARKEERGNQHLKSMATDSNSPSWLWVPTENLFTASPPPGEVNLFLKQNFFLLSFLSLRPALSSLGKQGLRVYTCDPNFPFCMRCFFFLKKNNSREVSEPLLFLRPMVTNSDRKVLYFPMWPKLWLIPDFTFTSFQVPPKAILSCVPGGSEHQHVSL